MIVAWVEAAMLYTKCVLNLMYKRRHVVSQCCHMFVCICSPRGRFTVAATGDYTHPRITVNRISIRMWQAPQPVSLIVVFYLLWICVCFFVAFFVSP